MRFLKKAPENAILNSNLLKIGEVLYVALTDNTNFNACVIKGTFTDDPKYPEAVISFNNHKTWDRKLIEVNIDDLGIWDDFVFLNYWDAHAYTVWFNAKFPEKDK